MMLELYNTLDNGIMKYMFQLQVCATLFLSELLHARAQSPRTNICSFNPPRNIPVFLAW